MSSPKSAIHTHCPPWPSYAMDWSPTSERFCNLAIGSFAVPNLNGIQPPNNIQVVSLEADRFKQEAVVPIGDAPATKIMWSPMKIQSHEYLACSGDGLQLWRRGPNSTFERLPKFVSSLAGSAQRGNPPAPVTSFDWSIVDPRLLVTSAYDTTCTLWNLETGTVKTQLIAHDREVFDVACSPLGADVFVSVGAEGSMRLFDVRTLDHSTILYETGDARPLLRVQWNTLDPNYVACFALDADKVVIIDIRAASLPVAQLGGGHQRVQVMRWAPHASNQMITCDAARKLRLWDLAQSTGQPAWGNETGVVVQSVVWPSATPEWIALGAQEIVQAFKVQ